MVLNCNHTTGNIITSKFARIQFQKQYDTIYNHYYNAKKEDGFHFGDKVIPPEQADRLYEYFWYLFFRENTDLVEEIKKYDDYTDNHGDEFVSTAKVFKTIKLGGLNGLKQSCKQIRKLFESKKEMSSFDEIKVMARKIVQEKPFLPADEPDGLNKDALQDLIQLYSEESIQTEEYTKRREREIYQKWMVNPDRSSNIIEV